MTCHGFKHSGEFRYLDYLAAPNSSVFWAGRVQATQSTCESHAPHRLFSQPSGCVDVTEARLSLPAPWTPKRRCSFWRIPGTGGV